jgi:hypothetical protein
LLRGSRFRQEVFFVILPCQSHQLAFVDTIWLDIKKEEFMKHSMRVVSHILVCLVFILLIQACKSNAGEDVQGGMCGDGVCDSMEKNNPNLCPSDCEEDEDLKCEFSEWLLEIEGCGTLEGTEPAGENCTSVKSCITVSEDCQIEGIGSGIPTSCEYTSPTGTCSYDVECSSFDASIGGAVVMGEEGQPIFKITIDPSGSTATGEAFCAGVKVPFTGGSLLQDAFGSAVRNGGGYFATIEAEPDSGVRVNVKGEDSFSPYNLSYQFYVYLTPGCD